MTKYWATQARLQVPLAADGRVVVNAYGRHHDYPREDFFGLGPDSIRAEHTSFQHARHDRGHARHGPRGRPAQPSAAAPSTCACAPVKAAIQPHPRLASCSTTPRLPGLGASVDFVRSSAFVDLDARRPRNARRGGWYRAELSHYADRDQHRFSFKRLDVDLRQFVSVLSERRVFMGRAFVSTSDTARGQTMPFYLMPTLGGNDSLRGFRDYRFRGPHAVLLQGEYRFEVWSGLDAALFYDAGKVAMRRRDLNLRALQSDYGVGLRVNTDNGLILRVDSAFGSRDGAHLWVVLGGVF